MPEESSNSKEHKEPQQVILIGPGWMHAEKGLYEKALGKYPNQDSSTEDSSGESPEEQLEVTFTEGSTNTTQGDD